LRWARARCPVARSFSKDPVLCPEAGAKGVFSLRWARARCPVVRSPSKGLCPGSPKNRPAAYCLGRPQKEAHFRRVGKSFRPLGTEGFFQQFSRGFPDYCPQALRNSVQTLLWASSASAEMGWIISVSPKCSGRVRKGRNSSEMYSSAALLVQ
jgi:hypothetical protein